MFWAYNFFNIFSQKITEATQVLIGHIALQTTRHNLIRSFNYNAMTAWVEIMAVRSRNTIYIYLH
jgi:hypothetical protein